MVTAAAPLGVDNDDATSAGAADLGRRRERQTEVGRGLRSGRRFGRARFRPGKLAERHLHGPFLAVTQYAEGHLRARRGVGNAAEQCAAVLERRRVH